MAISVRLATPSLARMLRTWLSTVRSESTSRSAICRLVSAGGHQPGDLPFAPGERVGGARVARPAGPPAPPPSATGRACRAGGPPRAPAASSGCRARAGRPAPTGPAARRPGPTRSFTTAGRAPVRVSTASASSKWRDRLVEATPHDGEPAEQRPRSSRSSRRRRRRAASGSPARRSLEHLRRLGVPEPLDQRDQVHRDARGVGEVRVGDLQPQPVVAGGGVVDAALDQGDQRAGDQHDRDVVGAVERWPAPRRPGPAAR